jgi:hypothetical protein
MKLEQVKKVDEDMKESLNLELHFYGNCDVVSVPQLQELDLALLHLQDRESLLLF